TTVNNWSLSPFCCPILSSKPGLGSTAGIMPSTGVSNVITATSLGSGACTSKAGLGCRVPGMSVDVSRLDTKINSTSAATCEANETHTCVAPWDSMKSAQCAAPTKTVGEIRFPEHGEINCPSPASKITTPTFG